MKNSSNSVQIGADMWRQLNRISIPTFNGDKRAYGGWKAAFLTCVDAAPATAEYKLLQLRSYLRGEALQVIERLGHSAMAYESAKERLERKYGVQEEKSHSAWKSWIHSSPFAMVWLLMWRS